MDLIIKNCFIFEEDGFVKGDILIRGGRIAKIAPCITAPTGIRVLDINNSYIFPGFVDVHVHLREPGLSYKETIRTGTLAAAHGGYTSLCAMPNVEPVPDSIDGLYPQLKQIFETAAVRVLPYGSITRGREGTELSDMEELSSYVAAFSDDGCGVQSESLMREAMIRAKKLGKLIVAHCEDKSVPESESEWRQLARDLQLVRETGCAYHACHISKKESVELMRRAKAEGLNVSCETAPHYLLLDDTMLRDDGRFKMNPPIGTAQDRNALIEALRDGTIDMIATDHAPHSAEEKSRGFSGSLNGIVGLECAFAALYTGLVNTGIISLTRLVEAMSTAPARRFGLGGGKIRIGAPADMTVFDLSKEYAIDSDEFLSMGRSTPFEGMKAKGRCLLTISGDKVVWEESKEEWNHEKGRIHLTRKPLRCGGYIPYTA